MKISFSKRILVIGSILSLLISPLSAKEEKPPSQEVFNKSKAATLYGMGLCVINNGGASREQGEKFIIEEMINDQIHTGYFRDKRVELAGEMIAESLGKDCTTKIKNIREVWKLLASKPIKEESNLFNNLIVKNFQKEYSSLLCQTYRLNKKDLLNDKFTMESNQVFRRHFNVDFSKFRKKNIKKEEDFKRLYQQEMLRIYDRYDVAALKGKDLKSFRSILSSTCPEAKQAWNYYATQGNSESVKESSKDNNSGNNIDKSFDEKHKICLKAADYKGCMKYQNR